MTTLPGNSLGMFTFCRMPVANEGFCRNFAVEHVKNLVASRNMLILVVTVTRWGFSISSKSQ